jgi:hypothetical protein
MMAIIIIAALGPSVGVRFAPKLCEWQIEGKNECLVNHLECH